MPKRKIDLFLNEALAAFSQWLKVNDWNGKEHDCVNLFAHKFLFEKIEPGAAIYDPTQVCIECALKQPDIYTKQSARKDLVIWEKPLQNTWSKSWEAIHSPKAVMEWKVSRHKPPNPLFDFHDEEWITSYTNEHPERFGYVVSVDLSGEERRVYWKKSKQGQFKKTKCI